MTKLVTLLLCIIALPALAQRGTLAADMNMYVSPSGIDTGSCASAGAPCATPSYAYAWAQKNLDLACNSVNVHVMASYPAVQGFTFSGPLVGACGPHSFAIDGGAPWQTSINGDATKTVYPIYVTNGAQLEVRNLTLTSPAPSSADILIGNGVVYGSNIWFGATGNAFVDTAGPMSMYGCSGPQVFLIDSSPNIAYVSEDHSMIALPCPLIVSGNPHWRTAFAQADLGGMIDATGAQVTPAAANGKRYNASQFGIVFTGGTGNENFFPGDKAGSADGGYYQ